MLIVVYIIKNDKILKLLQKIIYPKNEKIGHNRLIYSLIFLQKQTSLLF